MRFIRRSMGAVVLLLSTVTMLACIAAIVAVWIVRPKVAQKVRNVSSQVHDGIQRASIATENIQRVLRRARLAVAEVNKQSADVGEGDDRSRRAKTAMLRRLIEREAGPNINELGGRLATFSDVAVAVASMLESLDELPPGQAGRIDPDKLKLWANQATQAQAALRRLQDVVGDQDTQTGETDVAAATSEVLRVLERCHATVDDWQSQLDGAREELSHYEAEIQDGLTPTAITVTVVCAWVAVSQLSLLAVARRWCSGRQLQKAKAP